MAKPEHLKKTKILGESIEDAIKRVYPGDLGKEMVKCLKESLKKPKDQQKQAFIDCVRLKFNANEIPDENMTEIMNKLDPLDHYTKIG